MEAERSRVWPAQGDEAHCLAQEVSSSRPALPRESPTWGLLSLLSPLWDLDLKVRGAPPFTSRKKRKKILGATAREVGRSPCRPPQRPANPSDSFLRQENRTRERKALAPGHTEWPGRAGPGTQVSHLGRNCPIFFFWGQVCSSGPVVSGLEGASEVWLASSIHSLCPLFLFIKQPLCSEHPAGL